MSPAPFATTFVSACLFAALLFSSGAAKNAVADGDPAPFSIEARGDTLAVHVISQDPYEIAVVLNKAAGIRIEGLEVLRGQPPLTFHFESIPAAVMLNLLAMEADTLVRSEGPEFYQFGTAGEASRVTALYEALQVAIDTDEANVLAAEDALLDFIRPLPEGPVLLDTEPWLEAARRAERSDDLARASSLLREAVAHTERRDGGRGAELGLAMARLGRMLSLQGDAAQNRVLAEQGLALAEAELGPVHTNLAGMQATVASFRKWDGRFAEAEDLYRRAIQGHDESAEDDQDVLRLSLALDGLATMFQQQNRWAESIPLLERSFKIRRDAFGEDLVGFQAWLLGIALFKQDRLAESEPMLQHAIKHWGAGRRNTEQLLAVIQLLGSFAAPDADTTQLAELRNRTATAPAEAVLLAGGLLEDRALRQLRETPDSSAWQTSCAAHAMVSTPIAPQHGAELINPIIQRDAQHCEQRVREAIAAEPH